MSTILTQNRPGLSKTGRRLAGGGRRAEVASSRCCPKVHRMHCGPSDDLEDRAITRGERASASYSLVAKHAGMQGLLAATYLYQESLRGRVLPGAQEQRWARQHGLDFEPHNTPRYLKHLLVCGRLRASCGPAALDHHSHRGWAVRTTAFVSGVRQEAPCTGNRAPHGTCIQPPTGPPAGSGCGVWSNSWRNMAHSALLTISLPKVIKTPHTNMSNRRSMTKCSSLASTRPAFHTARSRRSSGCNTVTPWPQAWKCAASSLGGGTDWTCTTCFVCAPAH